MAPQMMKMYRYESRLQFMLFRMQFWEKYDQLIKVRDVKLYISALVNDALSRFQNMTVVVEVSDSLRHSESFKELLCVSIHATKSTALGIDDI